MCTAGTGGLVDRFMLYAVGARMCAQVPTGAHGYQSRRGTNKCSAHSRSHICGPLQGAEVVCAAVLSLPAGSLLTLSGPGAYDAAVHCASVSAARRSTSSPSDRPVLPPLPLRQQQQQQQEGAVDAASEDAQQPPTTPRLSDRQQQPQQQLVLPSRLSSTTSSSNSLGAAAAAASDVSGPFQLQQQQGAASDAVSAPVMLGHGRTLSSTSSSNGDSTPLPSPSSSSSTSSRLRRSLSRGRASTESGIGSSIRSLSRSRSAGSSAHSRNSSSNSLSEPDAVSMPGCFPGGLSSSNNLIAEAERGMSSSASSASGGSSGSRRGAGLGRKLRDALAELLISK